MVTEMMGVRLSKREDEEIKKLVESGMYVSSSEFIRDSIRKNLASIKFTFNRDIPKTQAKREILDYMKTVKESYASDVAEALSLDMDMVISVMKELASEGVVA